MCPAQTWRIAVVVRGDNSGPHTPQEIADIYADLGQRFPHAKIVATNLTEIGNAIQPYRNHLPIETREIGDTWIYGVASDPLKVARYRELCRLRESWISANKFQVGDETDLRLLRHVLLEAEHTWGTDTKTWLDFEHYTPQSLEAMLNTKNYQVVEFSWQEKRQDLFDGIAALPAPLRDEAQSSIAALAPARPEMTGLLHQTDKDIETEHFILKFDPNTGAIHRLRNKQTGREWASPDHPLALFSYQTLSQTDYQQLYGRLSDDQSRLGVEGFRQAEHRTLRCTQPELVTEAHRASRAAHQRGTSRDCPNADRRFRGIAKWSRSISRHDVSGTHHARCRTRRALELLLFRQACHANARGSLADVQPCHHRSERLDDGQIWSDGFLPSM